MARQLSVAVRNAMLDAKETAIGMTPTPITPETWTPEPPSSATWTPAPAAPPWPVAA